MSRERGEGRLLAGKEGRGMGRKEGRRKCTETNIK